MAPLIILAVFLGAMLIFVLLKLLNPPPEEKPTHSPPEPQSRQSSRRAVSQQSRGDKRVPARGEPNRVADRDTQARNPQTLPKAPDPKPNQEPRRIPVLKPTRQVSKRQPALPQAQRSYRVDPNLEVTPKRPSVQPSPNRNGTAAKTGAKPGQIPLRPVSESQTETPSTPSVPTQNPNAKATNAPEVMIPRSVYSPKTKHPSSPPTDMINYLRSLLGDPGTAKTAILLSEVLGPPVSRARRS
ncbi:MAG: hypothetical protein ACFCD0_12675 [Gemmataceae bacterium]